MEHFSSNMLPLLGVVWHNFSSLKEAKRFAQWAQNTTAGNEYPCDTYYAYDDDEKCYVVKVTNW